MSHGLTSIHKTLSLITLFGNILIIFLLWLSAASVYVPASTHKILVPLGLLFPLFLVGNTCCLCIWFLLSWRKMWIPLVGFIGCVGSIRTYCPINFPSPPPAKAIKILSYNVMSFPGDKGNGIISYLEQSQADIICYQEGTGLSTEEWQQQLLPAMHAYPYRDTLKIGSIEPSVIGIFSRFPILSKERIYYESKSNGSMAYTLKIGNDTVLVVNNHFESNRLSTEDRSLYKTSVEHPKGVSLTYTFRLLASKIGDAGKKRRYQVDKVANYIKNSPYKSVIVCGDFNDSPISYTHQTLAKNLRDAYVASGNGPGFSFNRDGILVRIDNILCSRDWKSYGAHVDKSIDLSDHYPIFCYLAK